MDFWEVAPNKKLIWLCIADGFKAYKSFRDLNLRITLLKVENYISSLRMLPLSLYVGARISAYILMEQNKVFPFSSFIFSRFLFPVGWFAWSGSIKEKLFLMIPKRSVTGWDAAYQLPVSMHNFHMHHSVPVDACLIAKLLNSFFLANTYKEIRNQRKALNWSHCISLKVLYDDGEQEVLNLLKERWELTGERKGLKVRFWNSGLVSGSSIHNYAPGISLFYPLHLYSNPGKHRSLK
jgi:hypothetical protein